MAKATPGLVIATPYRHSDLEHAARTFRDAGIGTELLVPHDTNALYAGAVRLLGTANPVVRTLRMRAYDPPGRSIAVAPAMYHAARLRLGRGTRASMNWRAAFDRAVARRLAKNPPLAFVGLTAHSPLAMREAVSNDVTTSFLYYNGDMSQVREGFGRELAEARTELERREIVAEMPPAHRAAEKEAELRWSDQFIVESLIHERLLVACGIAPERVFRVVQAVDVAGFRVVERDTSASRPLRVIHVGSVGYRKGLRWLMEAAALAPNAVERVDVVGYVLARATELRRLAPSSVRFRGEVPHEALRDLYARADVFVLTSFSEGMARVVFEAMACGLPVIVTPQTGYEGVITDGFEGYFVPPFDAEAIAEKLTVLANDGELRQRMGRAARTLAEQYPWSRFEETFLRELTTRVPALNG